MHSSDKRRNLLIGLITGTLLLVGAGIIWIISYSAKDPLLTVDHEIVPASNDIADKNLQLIAQDKLMQAHLNDLYKLDETYISLLEDTTRKKELTELNTRIEAKEALFTKSIDSIARQELAFSNADDEIIFLDMIGSFKQAYQNRRSMEALRNTVENNHSFLTPETASFLKLKNELNIKDSRIEKLEYELAMMSKRASDRLVNSAGPTTGIVNASKENSNEQENKIAGLMAVNNALQKKYDRLAKLSGEEEADNREDWNKKKISLENKIEELTVELSLAKVDCNLTRTDAGQIISNSKQRRLLLAEALNILNNLSNSDNVVIQKKIQEKITRLNQVAKNYRD